MAEAKISNMIGQLIRNSCLALDLICFESWMDDTRFDAQPELFIHIVPDKTNNSLSIIDSGIGMTMSDLDEVAVRAESRSVPGIFCVDFYDKCPVTLTEKFIVTTKHDDDEQCVSDPQAGGSLNVTRDTAGESLGRGTKVTIFLKEDELEYLEECRLKDLIKKHSKVMSYPISLWTEKTLEKEISDDEDEEDKKDAEGKVEDVDVGNLKRRKRRKAVSHEWVVVNKPIWMRKPEEITREEYAALYKSLTDDSEEHLAVKHFSVEGQLEFKAVLFVPKRAPFDDLFDTSKELNNIKLFVRHVYAMDACEEWIPVYLSFIEGIVDFEGFHLNMFRKMLLQQNGLLKGIKENLVKNCIELFFEIAENKEDYNKFYETFSKNLKFGICEDSQNKSKLAELLRYHSTKSGAELTSLEDYVTRMKDGQNDIYYITGESKKAVENSPFLEKLKKGYEVLFMVDAIDEHVVGQLKEFDGKKLVSATEEGLKVDENEDEKQKKETLKEKFEGLCKVIKDVLEDRVENVVVSDSVVDSAPCRLVANGECIAYFGRFRKLQELRDSSKNTMEINPKKPIMEDLSKRDDTMEINPKKPIIPRKRVFTMEINPENRIIEEMREKADADKNDEWVKYTAVMWFQLLCFQLRLRPEDVDGACVSGEK